MLFRSQKSGASSQDIIENPILSNFKEGLSILEYFISTHGARKGSTDTALKTAESGYLTRRLVDVSQDVIVVDDDCGTERGIVMRPITSDKDETKIIVPLYDRIVGRYASKDIEKPKGKGFLLEKNQLITDEVAADIIAAGIDEVEIRSNLTCHSENGVCAKCYGRNLASNMPVEVGEAVGIISAQSIGEPGTQLTLRTFHVGGIAGNISEENSLSAKFDGITEIEDLKININIF